ncbi:MAG: ABC transporter ATP-binding protein [Thermodesulfovibrionales bacterium]|nr:ABC transporter ATP-binding protein [Thermodesulfovibrionales bacterium]
MRDKNKNPFPCDEETITQTLAVHCKGITKSYGNGNEVVNALNGINLDVFTGQLTMLVGPSGCGKTTLISIMAGILDQDDGDCVVFGKSFKDMNEFEKTLYRGNQVGFVFQSFNLIPTLTAVENVAIPLLIRRTDRKLALEKAAETLKNVALSERINALPSQLSGGQQQRVAIARSLVHEPRLIVCDEPTSSLDHETGFRIMELLQYAALCADRALVIVTHDPRIFDFADRIAKMDDGRIVEVFDSPEDMKKS